MTRVVDADASSTRSAASLVGVVLTLFGLVAGLADYWLVQAARSYCGAAADPDRLGALLLVHLPSRLLLGTVLGGGGYVVGRWLLLAIPAIRRSPSSQTIRTVGAALAAAVAIMTMILIDFSVVGTPDGLPAESGLCPSTNIPPWWPTWLPA